MLACDVNKEWTDRAQEYWTQAGVRHKVPYTAQTFYQKFGMGTPWTGYLSGRISGPIPVWYGTLTGIRRMDLTKEQRKIWTS